VLVGAVPVAVAPHIPAQQRILGLEVEQQRILEVVLLRILEVVPHSIREVAQRSTLQVGLELGLELDMVAEKDDDDALAVRGHFR